MELLWIFVGIIYVVYKLYSERSFVFSWIKLLKNILTISPVIIGGTIISLSESNQSTVGMIIGAIVLFIGFGIAFVYLQSDNGDSNTQNKNRYSLEEVREEFLRCGYAYIKSGKLENLMHNPYSPLKTLNLTSAGTIVRCYKWMCDYDTWEIDKLSQDDIGLRLRVPLDDIPMDQSLSLGDASLKRTTLVKDYLLKRDGLRYQNYKQYLDESDEYYTTFKNFVDDYLSEHH